MDVSVENQRRIQEAAKQQEANEQKLKRAQEREQRMKKAFQQAKAQSSTQIRLLQRTHSIADHQLSFNEPIITNKKQVDIVSAKPYNLTPFYEPIDQDEWDSLEGVSLLDALIAKFSDDTEASQSLSLLAQYLVLQIDVPEHKAIWGWLNEIARYHVNSASDLILVLKDICQDIELIQLIVSNRQEYLFENVKQSILKKIPQFNQRNVGNAVAIIYHFRQLDWSYEELRSLVTLQEENVKDQKTNDAKNQLKNLFGDRIISVVTDMLVSEDDADNQKVMEMSAMLKELYQCSCRNNSTIDDAALGPFFDQLVNKLKGGGYVFDRGNKKKTSDQIETILNEFARNRLNVTGELHHLLPDAGNSSAKNLSQQLDKLIFLLNHVRIEAKELDKIRSQIEKEKLAGKETFKSILLITDRAFEKFYWNRQWSEIKGTLDQFKKELFQDESSGILSNEASMIKHWDTFLESVNRLKTSLKWTHSRKSFQQKHDICSELKKKLKKSSWSDTFSSALDTDASEAKTKHFGIII